MVFTIFLEGMEGLILYPAILIISALYLLGVGIPILYGVWLYSQKRQKQRSHSYAATAGFGAGMLAYLILNTFMNILANQELMIVHEFWTTLGCASIIGGGYGLVLGILFSRNNGFKMNEAEPVGGHNSGNCAPSA